MKKIGIDCPYNGIADSAASHRASHAYLRMAQWRRELSGQADVRVLHGEPWEKHDEIWLYHGMEWSGSLNMPGGMTEANAAKLRRLASFDGVIRSIDVECPAYDELIMKRKEGSSMFDAEELLAIKRACDSARSKPTIRDPFDPIRPIAVIGDSHALSMGHPLAAVARNDFKTLHGAVDQGFSSLAGDCVGEGTRKLITYFGNIDIRHHICRLRSDFHERKALVQTLVSRYMIAIDLFLWSRRIEPMVCVVAPLPIESVDRVLPKSGYHLGRPYWGAWTERDDARLMMTELLKRETAERGYDLYVHPSSYCNDFGELSFDAMERPRSVHLARSAYPWDLENDRLNPNLTWSSGQNEAERLFSIGESK